MPDIWLFRGSGFPSGSYNLIPKWSKPFGDWDGLRQCLHALVTWIRIRWFLQIYMHDSIRTVDGATPKWWHMVVQFAKAPFGNLTQSTFRMLSLAYTSDTNRLWWIRWIEEMDRALKRAAKGEDLMVETESEATWRRGGGGGETWSLSKPTSACPHYRL